MGKTKKHNFNHQFKQSVDPRFNGLFGSNVGNTNKYEQLNTDLLGSIRKNERNGFQDFVGTKLYEFLDKNLKEVDRQVTENPFFNSRLEGIQLFSNSNIISELKPKEQAAIKPPKKKKHKKHKRSEKESFQDVIVTLNMLQNQAKLLNS